MTHNNLSLSLFLVYKDRMNRRYNLFLAIAPRYALPLSLFCLSISLSYSLSLTCIYASKFTLVQLADKHILFLSLSYFYTHMLLNQSYYSLLYLPPFPAQIRPDKYTYYCIILTCPYTRYCHASVTRFGEILPL